MATYLTTCHLQPPEKLDPNYLCLSLALDLRTTRRGDWRFPTAGGFVWAGGGEEESPRQELQELCYARVVRSTSGWGCSHLKGDVSESTGF